MDLMIDYESLGSGPHAYLLSLGLVLFDPKGGEPLAEHQRLFYFKPQDQTKHNRHIEPSTLNWWLGDSKRRDLLNKTMRECYAQGQLMDHIILAIDNFLNYTHALGIQPPPKPLFDKKYDSIWARGTNFDVTLLTEMYKQFNVEPFWDQTKINDVRTTLRAARIEKLKPTAEHDALADCMAQVNDVQRACRLLWGKPA